MNPDRIRWQTGELGNQCLGQSWSLRAHPQLAAILAKMDGAVHRLHRRMSQKRQLINNIETLRCSRERFLGVALIAGHGARLP